MRAFSAIELLVVLAIMGILQAAIFPMIANTMYSLSKVGTVQDCTFNNGKNAKDGKSDL